MCAKCSAIVSFQYVLLLVSGYFYESGSGFCCLLGAGHRHLYASSQLGSLPSTPRRPSAAVASLCMGRFERMAQSLFFILAISIQLDLIGNRLSSCHLSGECFCQRRGSAPCSTCASPSSVSHFPHLEGFRPDVPRIGAAKLRREQKHPVLGAAHWCGVYLSHLLHVEPS